MTSYSHLSIATWNIQGIRNTSLDKTVDEDFINEIKPHHIIGLTETHCSPGELLSVPGYHAMLSCRNRSHTKAHGGIAVLVKNEIRKGIKLIQGNSQDTIWICLNQNFFNTDQDIYIGTVYLSPANSSYSQKLEYSPFELLTYDIIKFNEKGHIIVMGDFNSRTSTVSDLVVADKCDRISALHDVHLDENVLCRNSEDQGSRVCSHGNQLLEMCRSANLKISNGRTAGDQDGRYTCHTYNGSSLVDYILVSGERWRRSTT